ncbi:MAG: acyl-CoA desaturase [Deltaproteobacteria bacterium]|nr:MAG: acyl-CoA desaturase [Deltaproteobacteria bacterium]
MPFLDRVLRPPSYGWRTPEGELSVPTKRQLVGELFSRVNIFESRKNWPAFTSWFFTVSLAPVFVIFFYYHFSWPLAVAGFFYSMVGMGSYGTVWLHRYGTHGAYEFKSRFWRLVTRNLVIRVVPDEIYIISHHVHHAKSEKPGDPYNAEAGGLYCFLADTNHQPIARDLSRGDYDRVCRLMSRTGTPLHTYEQYLKWGTAEKPLRTIIDFLGNWAFWYGVFFLIGGHALATALFASAIMWAVGIRTFNYGAHGSGKDKQRDGVDFFRGDHSINQLWPGFVAGEWHNNHHLFGTSARNGFLWYQLDLPYLYIRFLKLIGAAHKVRNHTSIFFERHYLPYVARTKAAKSSA